MAAPVQVSEFSDVAASTTVAVAQGSNPTIGNTNAVWVRGPGGATVNTPTDTQGNTYTPRGSVIEAGTTQVLYQFTAPITGTGANTVTAGYGASTTNRGIAVAELPGTYDASNTGTDTGNNPTTAVSATNTNQPATLVMLCNDVQGGTPSVGTGFTNIGTGWATLGLNYRLQYKDVATIGSQSGDFGNAGFDRTNTGLVIFLGAVQPIITQQPVTQYVMEGGTVTFSVVGTFTGSPSYQWKRNGSNVGTSSASYSQSAAFEDNGSQFNVTVTDSNGSITSSTVYLYVLRVQKTAQKAQDAQGTTHDYSPGGWFGIQAGTTPAGLFDRDMILPPSAAPGHTAVAADTISFTDSAVAVSTLVAAASDTLTLTDSAVAITTRVTVASDTVSFSDTAVSGRQRPTVASDTITFSDSAIASSSLATVASDTVSFSDSATAISSLVAAGSDTLTFSDSAVSFTNRISVASDTLTLTDSAVAASTLVAAASDTITFSDSGVASRGAGSHTAVAADTVTFGDSATAISTLVAAANDSVSFTDTAIAASSLVAAGTDTVAFSDSAVSGRQRPAAAADSVTFSDSATAISSIAASASDSLTLTDSATSFTNRVSVAADTIAFSDSATASSTLAATASDTVAFTDSAIAQRLTGVVIAVASDTINFSDRAQGYTFTPPPQTGGGFGGGGGEGEDGPEGIRARWRDEARAKIAANNAFIMSLVGSMIREYEDEETP